MAVDRHLYQKYKQSGSLDYNDEYFRAISEGTIQCPLIDYSPCDSFLQKNPALKSIASIYKRNLDHFWRHYVCSIPYSFEHHCRVIHAIASFQKTLAREVHFYEASVSSGSFARTLAEVSGNSVRTLSNGFYPINERIFYSTRGNCNSFYNSANFSEVDLDTAIAKCGEFKNGFDVIYEHCTFQFFDSDRKAQIHHLSKMLNDSGVIIFFEKFKQKDVEAYKSREKAKDLFKAKYFTQEDLRKKEATVLTKMYDFQVRLSDFIETVLMSFKYVVITFEAFNFFEIMASNSEKNISAIIGNLSREEQFTDNPYVNFDPRNPIDVDLLLKN